MSRLEAIRPNSIVEQTCNRWKKKCGGMGVDDLKEPQRFRNENEPPKRAVLLTIDKLIPTEAETLFLR